MRIQRQTITTAALLAAVLAPTVAQAQKDQRIPVFLAVTFKSQGEPKLGIEAAEAIRQRLLRQYPLDRLRPGSMRVVKSEEIAAALQTSGFSPDSAISTTDLKDLGRQWGAAESMEGTVKRTAQGVEGRARIYLNSNIDAPEVLPVIVEKDAGALGRKIAEEYMQARKELPEYENCKNAIIAGDLPKAITAANAAMLQYSKGVLPRACLLTAYQRMYEKKSIALDSLVRVANEIVTVDPENMIALTQLVEAARDRGDTAQLIGLSMKIFRLNPTNTSVIVSIIDLLGSVGAPGPDSALVITEAMMRYNPGDVGIIQKQWQLHLKQEQWKRAIAAGEEMVRFDTAKADTNYFRRQIGAALKDSQPQLALQYLARVTGKFPRDVRLLQAYMLELRKQGQLQQALEVAKKVVAVDPRAEQGYATILVLYTELQQGDSAVAFARQVMPGADTATRNQIANGLLTLIKPALNTAQADTTSPADAQRQNWTEVYKLSAAVDSLVMGTTVEPQTAFFMSFSAFNLAMNALNRIGPLSAARNHAAACAELKTAADMVLIVDLNMGRGGRANPQAAGNILNALSGTIKPYLQSTRPQIPNCR